MVTGNDPDAALAAGAPQAPVPGNVYLSQQQLAALMAQMSQTNSTPTRVIVKPRLGGLNSAGAWTGLGSGSQGLAPKSATCMRDFETTVVKSFAAMAPIEDKCQKGLRDAPELLFCMSDESNANMTVNSLIAFEERMIHGGMEGVFHIVLRSGTTLNMFKEPGMCTDSIVNTWCSDVMLNGVFDPNNTNSNSLSTHSVCSYDRTNMVWSGEALLSSCTEALKQDLKFNVPEAERYGPNLLMKLLTKIYRPSQSKIENLKDKLKSMGIRKYPGENVTTFVQDASKLVREIKMNFTSTSSIPDLTTAALSGLTTATDDFLLAQVRTLRINSDVNGFGGILGTFQAKDPIEALQGLDDLYRILVSQSDYSPARQTSGHKALQAKAEDALVQDRNGSNSSSQFKGSCWDCGKSGVKKGHDGCPGPDGGATPNAGRRNATPKHGLDEDTVLKITEAIKGKNLPERSKIPDSAKYDVTIDGKMVAKYCRHCGRFTKGSRQHYTSEHTGTRSLFAYQPSPASSTPEEHRPAATAALAGINIAPEEHRSTHLSEVPTVDTDEFMSRQAVDYGFGFMARASTNTGTRPAFLEEYDSEDSDVFLDALVKEYGGQES